MSKVYDVNSKYALVVVWLAVFIPGHMFHWGIERLFILFLMLVAGLILYCKYIIMNSFVEIKIIVIFVILFLLSLLYCIAFYRTMLTSLYVVEVRDYIDVLRYVVIAAIIIVIEAYNKCELERVLRAIILVSMLYSLLVFFSYVLYIPVLSDVVHWIYADSKTAIAFPSFVRLAAPFENPNFLAFYCILCLSYVMFCAHGSYRLVSTGLVLLVLAATGSRSGWVSAFVLMFFLYVRLFLALLIASLREEIREDVIFTFMLSCVLALAVFFLFPYIQESSRVATVIAALDGGSITGEANLAGRIDMVNAAVGFIEQRPLLGWGPLKDSSIGLIDNQFFQIIARNGMIGFFLFFGLGVYIYQVAAKLMLSNRKRLGMFFMCMVTLLMLMTGSFLDNFRLLFLFLFFIAAISENSLIIGGNMRKPV